MLVVVNSHVTPISGNGVAKLFHDMMMMCAVRYCKTVVGLQEAILLLLFGQENDEQKSWMI